MDPNMTPTGLDFVPPVPPPVSSDAGLDTVYYPSLSSRDLVSYVSTGLTIHTHWLNLYPTSLKTEPCWLMYFHDKQLYFLCLSLFLLNYLG